MIMGMKRVITVIMAMLLLAATAVAQSIVPAEWKFITGDDPEYIDSAMNEYWWNDISPLTVWEKQGYEGYDGFAWYRVNVVVPASMKKNAMKYNGLILKLGTIDDADETFFNGHLVGSTGKMPPEYAPAYDVPRAYLIPPDYVNWDGKNTIAIRVYDGGGNGGMYGGSLELTNRGNADLLTLGVLSAQEDMIM